ncbi:ABC transporter ATP-binding protein [Paracoccus aerodenitrificans]|uniref:ABC transporter ATP-binding protein n=1 Tax=Paracoccus aerodenitrificans TaxID=3017781 RepID=UPI0022F050AF|nr:oligopeptide/dipeptide ABC transporter ATP-binding protein [Paracoccus aerodenitrificans]WBU63548.1 ATP-binding cassette domain-containing protein [Paracoccus aerodenitrificans]
MTSKPPSIPIIEARDLKTYFRASSGLLSSIFGHPRPPVRALDGVDLAITTGHVKGVVGESGCGKSTLGMTMVRMHEPTAGSILFRGGEVTHTHGSALKAFRRSAQIIFQDPYSSLNPRLTIGQIIEEPLKIHRLGNTEERAAKIAWALSHVRLPAEEYLHRFPSDLSGGQRQRVAIARALAMEPEFIVADEPVSMLDVSIQAGVLELLQKLSIELNLAVLYISHDIATVGYICDDVAVMYLGQVVEEGTTDDVLLRPLHPYTQHLMAAIPNIDPSVRRPRVSLGGEVPSPTDIPQGCRFADRCPQVAGLCRRQEPGLANRGHGRRVRCHLYLPDVDSPEDAPKRASKLD